MAKGFTFEIKGLKQLQDKFKKMPAELKEEVAGEVESFAQNVVRDAKSTASKHTNLGALVQSINYTQGLGYQRDEITFFIHETAAHAPYQEFGTGSGVKVDAEFSSYASTFKGRGKRKHNMKARPHLFPAFTKHRPNLLRNINAALKRTLQ